MGSNEGLDAVIRDMIETVIERNHYHISANLSRGLRIDMRRDDDLFTLLLSREDVYPSALEWNVVCRYIPKIFLQDEEEFKEFERSDRHWLRGYYRIPNAEVKVEQIEGKLVLTSKKGNTIVKLTEEGN